MPELNSHAFETAIAAGMKLHASKRLNTMSNDEAMKALATEILQTYMGIAVNGALTSARECAAWVNKVLFLDLAEHQELLLADIFAKTIVADRAQREAVVAVTATCKGGLQVGDAHKCFICGLAFKTDDICATDITEGTVHAACMDGSPVVDLHTGEPMDGPAVTFLYGKDDNNPSGTSPIRQRGESE